MTRNNAVLCFWLVVCAVGLSRHASAANPSDFIDFTLRNGRNQVLLPGRLYVPPKRPLSLIRRGQ